MSGFDQRAPRPGIGSSSAHNGGATPGKSTLVAAALPQTTHDFTPVQLAASENGKAPLDGGAVQQAAATGVAGSGDALPYRQTIQQLFGRHDVSGIKAHVGGDAATASRAIGAEAYATGNHVAFAGPPSLHTAAHEAAHVVQQRGGVQLKGGVGEQGDSHEQHANQVADRVVAGASAEELLDRYTGSLSTTSTGSSSVQRQATGAPPAPTPAPPVPLASPAPATPPEAYHAPTSAHDPNAPASRNATIAKVQTAATDAQAQDELDITWIDTLPDHLKNSIDEGFADSVAANTAQNAAKADGGLKMIDKEIDQQEKDLKTETITRLAAADPSIRRKQGRALEQALAADPTFARGKARLEADRAQRKQERKVELRAAADGAMAAGSRDDTVATPTTAKVTRPEGKALARTNFMSWAIDVLGSSAAAKQHFLGIQEVSRAPGMYLAAKAKVRFEAARVDFEAKHPGYSFPGTDVAQSLRGFHQARQGIGMLGHALGVAFDFLAYDNPNQKLGETDNYGYMLNRFGGARDTRGRSSMTLGNGGEDTVAQLGSDTAAGTSSPAGDAMVERIRTQFDEMSTTSDRLRASMAAELPTLSDARDTYFNSKETEKALAQATKDDTNAEKVADKRLKAEKFTGDDAAKALRREEIKRELHGKKEQLHADLDAAKTTVKQELAAAFATWAATIEADIAAARARQGTSEAELATQAKARADLNAINVLAPDAVDTLSTFADEHQLKKPRRPPAAAQYKLMLKNELTAKQKPRDKNDPLSVQYIQNEIAALNTWQQRIHDPKAVFGEGRIVPKATAPVAAAPRDGTAVPPGTAGTAAPVATAPPAGTAPSADAPAAPAKHWETKMVATNAPIMQFLENGFIRHDDMPSRSAGGGTKEVFNAELATTLARFGFSPGAAFRDTMHFDFIEGYGAAPGGRGQGNMSKGKYGPSGDKP